LLLSLWQKTETRAYLCGIITKKQEMINVNEYFEGNVKSLGYSREGGKSTVGVMEPGEYTFNTGNPEVMVVIEGKMEVLIAGEDEWKTYSNGEKYDVPGNSSFQLRIPVQTSYLCQYE
jgi:uncharacterized protein YaiE (UPF0345 family)